MATSMNRVKSTLYIIAVQLPRSTEAEKELANYFIDLANCLEDVLQSHKIFKSAQCDG
jgi:uncharacterized protein YecE (DUF72 family)